MSALRRKATVLLSDFKHFPDIYRNLSLQCCCGRPFKRFSRETRKYCKHPSKHESTATSIRLVLWLITVLSFFWRVQMVIYSGLRHSCHIIVLLRLHKNDLKGLSLQCAPLPTVCDILERLALIYKSLIFWNCFKKVIWMGFFYPHQSWYHLTSIIIAIALETSS